MTTSVGSKSLRSLGVVRVSPSLIGRTEFKQPPTQSKRPLEGMARNFYTFFGRNQFHAGPCECGLLVESRDVLIKWTLRFRHWCVVYASFFFE